jgi:hypothetical protein
MQSISETALIIDHKSKSEALVRVSSYPPILRAVPFLNIAEE